MTNISARSHYYKMKSPQGSYLPPKKIYVPDFVNICIQSSRNFCETINANSQYFCFHNGKNT